MYYIGLDPGLKGAYAIIRKGDLQACGDFDKPTIISLFNAIAHMPEGAICCLEKVHAMPKQGSVSMFTFGENYGWLKGVLDAFHIPFQEIPPQTWKKEFGLNSDKVKSVEVCRQLFPKAELIPPNCRKPHDGIAEAILMGLYAQRKMDVPSVSAIDEEHWD
jgi:crossover junction endodeoxyribonuclease RuvC